MRLKPVTVKFSHSFVCVNVLCINQNVVREMKRRAAFRRSVNDTRKENEKVRRILFDSVGVGLIDPLPMREPLPPI